jgi:hypothetical protein
MNTNPTLPRPWFRMLPDTMEKIQPPEDSGLEPAIKAERQRIREREKKRRHRARQAARPMVAEPHRNEIETFTTPSGIPAYRQFVPNRTALGSAPMTEKGEGGYVSLPFVSILAAP